MPRRIRRKLAIDFRPVVDFFGIAAIIEQIGWDRVIAEVGADRILAEIGEHRLLEYLRQLSRARKRAWKWRLEKTGHWD